MIKTITIRNVVGDLSIKDGDLFAISGAPYSIKQDELIINSAYDDVDISLPSTKLDLLDISDVSGDVSIELKDVDLVKLRAVSINGDLSIEAPYEEIETDDIAGSCELLTSKALFAPKQNTTNKSSRSASSTGVIPGSSNGESWKSRKDK
jgi:DUF4097 and DUF4098 domain-containing protein YvlB